MLTSVVAQIYLCAPSPRRGDLARGLTLPSSRRCEFAPKPSRSRRPPIGYVFDVSLFPCEVAKVSPPSSQTFNFILVRSRVFLFRCVLALTLAPQSMTTPLAFHNIRYGVYFLYASFNIMAA